MRPDTRAALWKEASKDPLFLKDIADIEQARPGGRGDDQRRSADAGHATLALQGQGGENLGDGQR